jgi:hypothetical protein
MPVELPDFSRIRNRNESRVQAAMTAFLDEHPAWQPQAVDLEDVYAAALNRLPARYRQRGTVVLHEPVSDAQVRAAVLQAVSQIVSFPMRAGS